MKSFIASSLVFTLASRRSSYTFLSIMSCEACDPVYVVLVEVGGALARNIADYVASPQLYKRLSAFLPSVRE